MTGNCAEDRPTGCGPCQQPSPYTPTQASNVSIAIASLLVESATRS
jgi:hypothetical protein